MTGDAYAPDQLARDLERETGAYEVRANGKGQAMLFRRIAFAALPGLGRRWAPARSLPRMRVHHVETAASVHLSERQTQIIEAIARGLPQKLVAKQLFITPATLQEHLKRAFQSYRGAGREVGNAHALVHEARRDGHLTD